MAENLDGLLDLLVEGTAESERVSVRDLLDLAADRSFGPLLAVLGLLVFPPLGAIPGIPTTVAVLMFLIVGQRLVGRKTPWLPGFVVDRTFAQTTLVSSTSRLRKIARGLDRVIKPRLTPLASGFMGWVLLIDALLLAALMVPLEVVPFAALVPGFAIMAVGLALMARDGVLATLALVATGITGWMAWDLISGWIM